MHFAHPRSWNRGSLGARDAYRPPLPSCFKTCDASYQVSIETGTLTMKDGTPLAVTFFKPVPKADGERFPVVLEMLPYHKDDYFYARDFAI